MSKKFLFTFLLLLTLAVPFGAAADRFYLEPADLELGKTETLSFILDNSQDYYGFQAEVKLPSGLSASKGGDGELDITLSSRADAGEYRVNSNVLTDGSLIMSVFSTNHKQFTGNDGVLVNLNVSVAESFTGGTIEVSNVMFVNSEDKDVEFDSTSASFGVKVTEIQLSASSAELKVGETTTLTVTVLPASATDKTVTWSSSDEKVAKVDAKGTVTAIALGEATVTAKCGDVTATCKVAVVPTPAESVTLDKVSAELKVGETVTLTATVLPDDTTDKTVTWTSSDEAVAKIDANGKVTAIALGEASITATCGTATATCKVTVIPTPAESVTLDKVSAELKVGETVTLTATVLPDDTTDKTVTWTSSDEAVAKIDANGKVTAIALGEASITATCGTATATCKVKVVPTPAESVTLDKFSAELKVGEAETLTATVLPDDTTDKTVTWTSSDEAVAKVDANGKVTAIGLGEATVTATCGAASATCKVTVIPTPAESVTLDKASAELKVGETVTLTATVLPEDTTDKTVTWTSSDEAVAKVDANGKVTAIGLGEATVTATCGAASVTCKVTVVPTPAESITIDKTSVELNVGKTTTVTATVLPESATDKTVIWTSSDEKVVTVDASGKLTAIALGEATVTATCGAASATCKVTVVPTPAESVTLDKASAELKVGETVTLTATVLPEDTTDKAVTWTSSDEAVAKVDANGKVTAIELGEATVTATCGAATATCKVTVVPTPVESIALSSSELNLLEGDTATLTATIAPENATDKTVTWSTSDAKIATVSDKGVVTAVKAGTATITATSANGKTANCEVTVTAKAPEVIAVTSVALDKTELCLTEGETATLTASIAPENATDKTVTWSTSDAKIATVSDKGVVTAVKAGTATITATSANGKTATCEVTVTAKAPEVIAVTYVALDKTELSMTEGETATLTASIAPENATDKTVTWSTSDSKIATVSDKGVVTAVKAGTATITATSANGKTATCEVTVTAKAPEVIAVTSVALDKTELSMTEGDTATLTATIAPENATDKTVTWSTSDEAVATVSSEGIVTAIKAGKATITATSANGKTATCAVTVAAKVIEVTGITLNSSKLSLTEGETATLTASIAPENATDKTVTWSTSDAKIATVSAEGVVTAVKAGTATITATSANGKTATCEVTVAAKTPDVIAVTSIALSSSELNLLEGENATLTATITPDNATDKTVTWSTSDEAVATVSAEGVVTAIKAGKATITATSANGKTATCEVTVMPIVVLVESLTIDPTSWTGVEGSEFKITATVLPENATDKSVAFESTDESVATVDAEGNVSVIAEGTCMIIVSTLDGSDLTAECVITSTVGVAEIFGESNELVDVYDMKGNMLKRGCKSEELKQLTPGMYILRSGNKAVKTLIR